MTTPQPPTAPVEIDSRRNAFASAQAPTDPLLD